LRAAARWERLSVEISLWSASRTIFKTAFDISAAQPKSWHRARQAERSGLGLTDTSTAWSAQAPVAIWCKRTRLHCVKLIPEVGIARSSRDLLSDGKSEWNTETREWVVWRPSNISRIILNEVIIGAVIWSGTMQSEIEVDAHWHEESSLQTQGRSGAG
jgi:hypothetical protein